MTASGCTGTDLDVTGRSHRVLPIPTMSGTHDIALLDRDGTLNELRPGYRTPEDFSLLPGAVEAVAALGRAGFLVVLVTNQRGIATGAITWSDLAAVNAILVDAVRHHGGDVHDVRLCPHERDSCGCRKPLPGLIHQFFEDNPHLTPARSVMVGDSESDAAAAAAAGVAFVHCDATRGLADVVDSLLAGRTGTIRPCS